MNAGPGTEPPGGRPGLPIGGQPPWPVPDDAGPIALDTVVWIHFIEDHPRWAPALAPLFERADSGALTLVTSAVTLLEVLVVPLRAGNLELAARYERILTRSRGVELVALDLAVLRSAANLRARFNLRTPDALRLAAAIARRCQMFLTNDRRLPGIPGLRIVRLDELG
jgi:predicted nucleic acid-binding protein